MAEESPKVVFLVPDMGDSGGRTWCDTRVTEEDVEYVSADRYRRLEEALRACGRYAEARLTDSGVPGSADPTDELAIIVKRIVDATIKATKGAGGE